MMNEIVSTKAPGMMPSNASSQLVRPSVTTGNNNEMKSTAAPSRTPRSPTINTILPIIDFLSLLSMSSQNHHHRTFRDLIVELLNVVHVHHDAAPGKMTRAAVVPLFDPAVKTDASAELRALECGGSLFPCSRHCGFLV